MNPCSNRAISRCGFVVIDQFCVSTLAKVMEFQFTPANIVSNQLLDAQLKPLKFTIQGFEVEYR